MKKIVSVLLMVILLAMTTIGGLSVTAATVDNVVGSFETSADRANFGSGQYTYFNPTFSTSTDVKATGASAVRVTLGELSDNIHQFEYKFSSKMDLANVEYVSFYIKNEGTLPLGFVFSVKSFYVLSSNVDETLPEENHDFWAGHLGAYYLQTHDVADAAMVRAKNSTTWSAASTAAVGDQNGAATPFVTLPAGFDGYVKIPLSAIEKGVETPAMCLQFAVGYKGEGTPQFAAYNGMSFVIDDIAFGQPETASSSTAATSENVQTGDSNVSWIIVMLAFAIAALAVVIRGRKITAQDLYIRLANHQ